MALLVNSENILPMSSSNDIVGCCYDVLKIGRKRGDGDGFHVRRCGWQVDGIRGLSDMTVVLTVVALIAVHARGIIMIDSKGGEVTVFAFLLRYIADQFSCSQVILQYTIHF